jgi:hypothetical protein
MSERILGANGRLFARLFLGVAVLGLSTQCLFGATCSVLKHSPPTEAGKAFLAADYSKAEGLYQAALAAHPGDVDATAGLIHTLLREQKVLEADEAVKTALEAMPPAAATSPAPASPAASATPNTAALLTLRGEVEFSQGEPWLVESTVLSSYKLDPCNPRTRLLFARLSQLNSRYATARQQILLAHQFDPEDPEIRAAWIQTLPLPQRIAEMEVYLSAPTGDDQETLHKMHSDLDRWRKQAGGPATACRLASTSAAADIPFINLAGHAGHPRAFGLEVGMNGNPTRLQVGAGGGGLSIYRSVADRAGLKRIPQAEPGGLFGKPTYIAYADSVKVGSLEFKNCPVTVIDSTNPNDDGDGQIGMDVFSDFLVTLDYPMHKLQLGPLPSRPAETSAPPPSLKTAKDYEDDPSAPPAGPYDRVIAPEMKDYTQIYRVGDNLVVPAALSPTKLKLFILDLNLDIYAPTTTISPGVAMDVTKVYEKDMGGAKVLIADEITYNFAHMSQKVNGVIASNTSMASKNAGMEISGFIGRDTFKLLVMHIDYRDGLLKCEYIPNRGYQPK